MGAGLKFFWFAAISLVLGIGLAFSLGEDWALALPAFLVAPLFAMIGVEMLRAEAKKRRRAEKEAAEAKEVKTLSSPPVNDIDQ